jgi:hypothetical protein
MQVVSAAFTAEGKDTVRNIAQSLQVSWHRQSTLGNRTFTIGVSTIGGTGVIGLNPGAIGSPGIYKYFDESAYLLGLSWERGLNLPQGGLTKALAEAKLDNTSGRFLPNYMGGSSELYTAIQPRKPIIINAGFNVGGVNITIPQFAGVLSKQPTIDAFKREVSLEATDYSAYFQNKDVSNAAMFTGLRTDQVIENLLIQQGMSTAQYNLDMGLNTIPFGMYDPTSKLSDVINELVQSENGNFYQDETGIFRFENRQHWDNAPFTQVQKIILTGQVINAQAPNDDHIINVVEVSINPRVKASGATLYTLSGQVTLGSGDTDFFVDFLNPVLQASAPVYVANSAADGSGANVTGNITVKNTSVFSQNAKYTFHNSSASTAYITSMTISGRWAVLQYPTAQVIRTQDDSSVTAYQEQVLSIDNQYIQDSIWAQSLGQVIVNNYSDPESLQIITIRAMPELQMGDLISWQGHYWRIFNIRAMLDPSVGFTQELSLLKQGAIVTYFRIGISTIGGSAKIAP